ncbi:alpha/beta fold hydrolase [Antrihabitans stalactiti]|uniref:alpha/beta fold hydrolase n=1 Tax=Antrihabitans stalactiti TaxID=2584121 RepID=UPI00197E5637|nr:alpha/beta fold hydrolase [Antrihabitans stalactiti]
MAGVSARALQIGFGDVVGMSSMTYLRSVRLDRVHLELCSGVAQSVTDVAAGWNFFHPGRAETSPMEDAESLPVVAGNRLAADRWTPSADPRGTVVLLHGGGQTRHSWVRTASHLADHGWLVFNVDARGHGASEWPPDGSYALVDFVADLRAIVGALDRPPVLVGASLGGRAALVAEGKVRDCQSGWS